MPISGGFHRGVEVWRQTNCPIFRHVCLCVCVCVCESECVCERESVSQRCRVKIFNLTKFLLLLVKCITIAVAHSLNKFSVGSTLKQLKLLVNVADNYKDMVSEY